ncbi:MAG: polysaccharide pyruvyl transferase family protein [Parolsenella sp.]|uniref:polysaccharide pyruvyl transferase family protein n=1 Tax=Parolsenella sp. TaxID=2083006 RepID=UPI002A74F2BC|nr:polysaccharide pyruvyl transferase family protein [Parolsenella sp.]MCI5950127.1 polysaccharide pyruvyl transferase family protein [Coriobacteriaceae bacterium]MDY3292084.1 polysaccharide pyruvyl transferase family protein [Parolsenella sp.]
MKKFATVSYNLYGNFTNYGSALQTYALRRAISKLAPEEVEAIVLDYCPDCLRQNDPLNPAKRMWDSDAESLRMVELTMPAIRENYAKFVRFYREECHLSKGSYTSEDFESSFTDEGLDGYVCGSDTIFCIREFGGFDDGYYANYPAMRGKSVSYAASFGDVDWTDTEHATLQERLSNFRALGIREGGADLDWIKANVDVPSQRVLDPTLLLTGADYAPITANAQMDEPYVLLYSRRYNPQMEAYAERIASQLDCKVVDISLRATNAERGHVMRYDAGVEEFLALTKGARYVVTNSFHGLIFAAQMHVPFSVFSREQADTKISQLLAWIGLEGRSMVTGNEDVPLEMAFENMEERLATLRKSSLSYLRSALRLLGAQC